MATAIRVEVLPARLGDCLLVECLRGRGRPWRMLVDGGPPDTWPTLQARLGRLDGADGAGRLIDVAAVTHIDADHIGGMLPFMDSPLAARVGDFWFNGQPHLPGPGPVRSVAQGESLVAALTGRPGGRVLPWNVAFGGGPIDTGDDGGFVEVPTDGGPKSHIGAPIGLLVSAALACLVLGALILRLIRRRAE